MKRILVAGATGYLGGHVVRELAERGHHVRALVRNPGRLGEDSGAAEVVAAQITDPETLEHVCDDIDVVFSSLGLTRQRDGLTFRDVDYQGNLNLLEAAKRAGVAKFAYVSVFEGRELRHLDMVDAHESFVDELISSGLDYSVIRPNGYFSDMADVFEMAKRGRVWVFGSGENRFNPIHGADLAAVCADAIEGDIRTVDVGGPEILTWNQLATTAFEVLDQKPRITHLPTALVWPLIHSVRLFSRHQGELLRFFATLATRDLVSPQKGRHRLKETFRSLADET